MLIQYVSSLAQCRLVLASASPRRLELLRSLGLNPEVVPSSFEEDLEKSSFATPGHYAQETATHKAIDVSTRALSSSLSTSTSKTSSDVRLPSVIIAADTIVEIDGRILEKPADEEGAFAMLSDLSGRKHKVYSGVAILLPTAIDPVVGRPPLLRSFHETTEVEFGQLSEKEIRAYIATGEPMDKAGGYGIQGLGGCLVKSINGCYFNVMGLPLHRLSKELSSLIESGELKLP